MNNIYTESKAITRANLEQHIKEYLAKGGKIQQISANTKKNKV